MISSASEDVARPREVLATVLMNRGFRPIRMEDEMIRVGENANTASLRMVRSAIAYICLIGQHPGQTLAGPENPDEWPVARLEFEEAVRLRLPILVFVLDGDHEDAFRKRAMDGRAYEEFSSVVDFEAKAIHAVAQLATDLYDARKEALVRMRSKAPEVEPHSAPPAIPERPELYAVPRYPAGNPFVGRIDELKTLQAWAQPADPNPILLFHAVGGSGKSMLAWEWVTKHAPATRDWAGIFWYSFYEEGATPTEFLRHALAYGARKTLEEIDGQSLHEIKRALLLLLDAEPFLFVLDGLERILVAYHRADASKMHDGAADSAQDAVLDQDASNTVHTSDGVFLKKLLSIRKSKFLITSRLAPNDLVGAQHVVLSGLRPDDAVALFRSSGITGAEIEIRDYLVNHCDCHPLVIMALAGTVVRSSATLDFGGWLRSPEANRLNFTGLDLVGQKNRIVEDAIESLNDKDRDLLRLVAILPSAADIKFLEALNPHLPPEISAPEKREAPRSAWDWKRLLKKEPSPAVKEWEQYELEVAARLDLKAFRNAPRLLAESLGNLARWGLIQRDPGTSLYDLHPVVRSVVVSAMGPGETERLGLGAVDHFTARAPISYRSARSLQDLAIPIRICKLYISMQDWENAAAVLIDDLQYALTNNLEEYNAYLELAQAVLGSLPTTEWPKRPSRTYADTIGYEAARCLSQTGHPREYQMINDLFLARSLAEENIRWLCTCVSNEFLAGPLSKRERVLSISTSLADLSGIHSLQFSALLEKYRLSFLLGDVVQAEGLWQELGGLGFDWPKGRQGQPEFWRCCQLSIENRLTEEELAAGLDLTIRSGNRYYQRRFLNLSAEWALRQGRLDKARIDCEQAIQLARSSRLLDSVAESLGLLIEAKIEPDLAEDFRRRVEALEEAGALNVAYAPEIWEALGETEKAIECATKYFTWAWDDGEPYVYRDQLNFATELLIRLGAPIPDLPPFDIAKAERFPWQDAVEALIAKKQREWDDDLSSTVDA